MTTDVAESSGAAGAVGAGLPDGLKQWLDFVFASSLTYSLDPALVLAVMQQESGGQNVVGADQHGRGVMQIDDRFHGAWLSQHNNGMDPASNIEYGCMLLRSNIDAFSGNLRNGVAAYNAGVRGAQNGLDDSGNPDQYTTGGHYSENILKQADVFRLMLDETPGSTPATYSVSAGDTLGSIAAQFNTTVDALVQFNAIANPNLIFVGQVVRIPNSMSRPGPADPTPPTVVYIVGPGIADAMRVDNTTPASDEIPVFGGRQDSQWADAVASNGTLYRWVRETNTVLRFPAS